VSLAFDLAGGFHDAVVWEVNLVSSPARSRLELVLGAITLWADSKQNKQQRPWGAKLSLSAIAQAEQVAKLSSSDDFLAKSIGLNGSGELVFCLYSHAVGEAPFRLIEELLSIVPEESYFEWIQENTNPDEA